MRNPVIGFAILLSIAASTARAQLLSFGVKGGVPVTDRTRYGSDESKPYLVGPSVELKLPAGFAIEADALYSRLGNSIGGVTLPLRYFNRIRANSWEFPVLGKHYFSPRAAGWQPYLGTGWAFRRLRLHNEGASFTTGGDGVVRPINFRIDSTADLAVGAVFAAGVRFRAGRLAVAPEFRYTRWGSGDNVVRKNQAGFFLGISF